jgi:hypothetical protein
MSMIGSLLYLMVTWPDIQFTVCPCVRFQASSRSSHQTAIQQPLGISNTHLSLGFGIPLLLRLILLAFPMLNLWVMGLTERALLVHAIFLGSSLVCYSS